MHLNEAVKTGLTSIQSLFGFHFFHLGADPGTIHLLFVLELKFCASPDNTFNFKMISSYFYSQHVSGQERGQEQKP